MVPVKDRPTFLALLMVAFFRVSFVILVCVVVGVRKAQSCIRLSYLGAARALIYSRGGELGIRIVGICMVNPSVRS